MFETSLLFNTLREQETQAPKQSIFHRLKPYLIPLVIISGIASVAIGLVLYRRPAPATINTSGEVLLSLENEESDNHIYVDISGAVERPGVYPVRQGDRVATLIDAAGGVSYDADTEYLNSSLNLSLKLKDEQKIYVPFVGESLTATTNIVSSSQSNTELLSINFATESQLDTLPKIGPATAQKIINGRPYSTIDELLQKKVVPQSVFDEIKLLINL